MPNKPKPTDLYDVASLSISRGVVFKDYKIKEQT